MKSTKKVSRKKLLPAVALFMGGVICGALVFAVFHKPKKIDNSSPDTDPTSSLIAECNRLGGIVRANPLLQNQVFMDFVKPSRSDTEICGLQVNATGLSDDPNMLIDNILLADGYTRDPMNDADGVGEYTYRYTKGDLVASSRYEFTNLVALCASVGQSVPLCDRPLPPAAKRFELRLLIIKSADLRLPQDLRMY